MIKKFLKMLKSRTFWTLVVMFATNGLQAIMGFLPPWVYVMLNGALTLVALYFKMNPSQPYGSTY